MSQSDQEMSFLENFNTKTKNLSRYERLNLRNDIIIMDLYTGSTKDKIATKFNLSVRQVERIIESTQEASDDWYKQLPKKYALAIHRRNSVKIFNEIGKLATLRSIIDDTEKEFNMTQGIIDAYIKYDKMLAEGPTLERQKELTEEMEEIVGDGPK